MRRLSYRYSSYLYGVRESLQESILSTDDANTGWSIQTTQKKSIQKPLNCFIAVLLSLRLYSLLEPSRPFYIYTPFCEIMKTVFVTLVSSVLLQSIVGFTVMAPPPSSTTIRSWMVVPQQRHTTSMELRSTPAENSETEEEGLDLNLEEMFTMFDAADKGVDFDKAIDQVKSEK